MARKKTPEEREREKQERLAKNKADLAAKAKERAEARREGGKLNIKERQRIADERARRAGAVPTRLGAAETPAEIAAAKDIRTGGEEGGSPESCLLMWFYKVQTAIY